MATFNGINYAKSISDPIVKVKGELNARVKVLRETFQMAAIIDTGEEVLGPSLPEGAIILDAYIKTDKSLGGSGTLDLGYKAFVDEDGNAVAEDQDALVQVMDVSSAAAIKRALGVSVGIGKKVGIGGAQIFLTAPAATVATDGFIEMVVIYSND